MMEMGIQFAKWKWQDRRSQRYIDYVDAEVVGVPLPIAKACCWVVDAIIFIKDALIEILKVLWIVSLMRLLYALAVVAYYIALFYFILYLIF